MDARAIIASLRSICGEDWVTSAVEDLEAYARDALGAQRGFAPPSATQPLAVANPASPEQVAAIIALAREHHLAVTPYGAGTGLMGGAAAVRGGIVLRTARLAAIRAIDPVDATVLAEAGCVLEDVSAALRPHGLMLAHDPWTVGIATVGGAISTDGLGFLGGSYGRMGAQVLGIEAVLADGTIVRTRDAPAHAAGIDLRSLLVGSEGTLGVITAARLQAFPVPEARVLRGWRFPMFAAGFEAVLATRAAGLVPAVLDYGERPGGDGEAVEAPTLYLGFDGAASVVAAQVARAGDVCAAAGGSAVSQEETDAFWHDRHVIAERFAAYRRARRPWRTPDDRGAFDYVHVALPASAVLAYYDDARAIASAHGVRIGEAGLWVSPRLFSLTLASEGATHDDATRRMSAAVDALLRAAHDAGGSIEYCHGLGLRLAHLAPLEYGAALGAVRAIKRALDPEGILNPGKLALDGA